MVACWYRTSLCENLLLKLVIWVTENNLPVPEKSGFRANHYTLDQHPTKNYSNGLSGQSYGAYDLTAVCDTISTYCLCLLSTMMNMDFERSDSAFSCPIYWKSQMELLRTVSWRYTIKSITWLAVCVPLLFFFDGPWRKSQIKHDRLFFFK